MKLVSRCASILGLFVVAACTGSTSSHGDGAADSLQDARDATIARCTSDVDCSDAVYCNGIERCAPSVSGADARGCVAPIAPPCASGMHCDEAMQRCTSQCDDADGDGHNAMSCGGDDCDDHDANRFPGHPETCDAMHDEDCDPSTLGSRDGDGDGHIDAMCCNDTPAGRRCGDDCNDSRTDVYTGLVETCDDVDNNCNGMTDEGVRVTCYPDLDDDTFTHGTANFCGLTCPAHHLASPSGAADCDDGDARAFPGQTMFFSSAAAGGGFDFNCDGTTESQYHYPTGPAPTCLGMTESDCVNTSNTRWWVSGEPACGMGGANESCGRTWDAAGTFFCGRTSRTDIQRCR